MIKIKVTSHTAVQRYVEKTIVENYDGVSEVRFLSATRTTPGWYKRVQMKTQELRGMERYPRSSRDTTSRVNARMLAPLRNLKMKLLGVWSGDTRETWRSVGSIVLDSCIDTVEDRC